MFANPFTFAAAREILTSNVDTNNLTAVLRHQLLEVVNEERARLEDELSAATVEERINNLEHYYELSEDVRELSHWADRLTVNTLNELMELAAAYKS